MSEKKKRVISIDQGGGKSSCVILENIAPTLTCTHYGEPAVCYGKDLCNREPSERFESKDGL